MKEASVPAKPGFPIVGLGASAGGLAAFELFLKGLPPGVDTGMAYILVQHLDPNHKSLLTELIRRDTPMQVFEVEDGMSVRPDCIYIIPPGRDLALLHGTLQLLEPSAPRGRRLPIDFFFQSLAQDAGDRAVAVVLSGSGSDGSQGIRAVKAAGGLVLVQSPETAQFDPMPSSALSTGLVDFELPPEEMPSRISAYLRQTLGQPSLGGDSALFLDDKLMKKIFVLLRSRTGHDFSLYKPSTLQRRIVRRMALQLIGGLDEYVRYLQQTPGEIEALFQDFLIGVTNFFRDQEAFTAFEEKVIPLLLDAQEERSGIRIWSAGCSTGEEAYSLAILVKERLEEQKRHEAVQIFATDIDPRAIARARSLSDLGA